MTAAGFFSLSPDEYTRTIDPVEHYIEQNAFYIAKQTGYDINVARQFIIDEFKEGRLDLHQAKAPRLYRDKHGDRHKEMVTLYQYIKEVVDDNLLIAPTMTTYLPPEVKRSLLSDYIIKNMNLRKGFKKQKFKYEMAESVVLASFYDMLQNSTKIKNNALSGTQAVKSNVLFNKSAHSSLTSSCRVITSVSNALNEKFIRGNRHYWSPQIVLNNIIAIANDAKHYPVKETMAKFNIHVPTVDDVMACIHYSTGPYWKNWELSKKITRFVEKLTDEERAFFLYGMDLYHLAKHNDELVRNLLTRFIQMPEQPIDDVEAIYQKVNEDVVILAALLAGDLTKGCQIGDIRGKTEDGQWKFLEKNQILAGNCLQISDLLDEYQVLFTTFFRPNLLPQSVADLPDMYRRAVPVSDTDSSIFTTMYWGKWITGKYSCDELSTKTSYLITYFITQSVIHNLAMLSANLGVSADKIHDLKMKNEYAFPVFILSQLSKHYLALITAQEGNLLPKMKFERKGVNLRNSAASTEIVSRLHQLADQSMLKVYSGESVELAPLLSTVAELEKLIFDDIRSGSPLFLRSIQVKEEESYSQKDNAPAVKQHNLWENVFADKYGAAPELPYKSFTVTLKCNSKNKFNKWVETIEDRVLADKLSRYCEKNFQSGLPTIRLPIANVSETGIPVELIDQSEFREVVRAIMAPFYIILAAFGLPLLGDKARYMLSDDIIEGFDGVI
jgi:hypothetical protein